MSDEGMHGPVFLTSEKDKHNHSTVIGKTIRNGLTQPLVVNESAKFRLDIFILPTSLGRHPTATPRAGTKDGLQGNGYNRAGKCAVVVEEHRCQV